MKKIVITEEDKRKFIETNNGMNKRAWMKVGILIDLISTIAVCLVIMFSSHFTNSIIFYVLLYLLEVLVVIGGEFIGTYYGALEQYVISKNEKKHLEYYE